MDKETKWLAKVAERHNEWINMVHSFGEYDFADDLVQQMYLTIYKYANEEKIIKNGIVSRGYIYFTIRSLYFQYYNSKKKIKKVYLDDEENTLEIPNLDEMDEEVAFNNKWINKKRIGQAINFYGNCEYSRYLNSIVKK